MPNQQPSTEPRIRNCLPDECRDCLQTSSTTASCGYAATLRPDRSRMAMSLGAPCHYNLPYELPAQRSPKETTPLILLSADPKDSILTAPEW